MKLGVIGVVGLIFLKIGDAGRKRGGYFNSEVSGVLLPLKVILLGDLRGDVISRLLMTLLSDNWRLMRGEDGDSRMLNSELCRRLKSFLEMCGLGSVSVSMFGAICPKA